MSLVLQLLQVRKLYSLDGVNYTVSEPAGAAARLLGALLLVGICGPRTRRTRAGRIGPLRP